MVTPRRPRLSGMVCAGLTLWLLIVSPGRALGQLKPKLDQCTLSLDSRTLKPVGTSAQWAAAHWVGDRRFIVHDDSIAQIKPTDAKAAWILKTPDGHSLDWLAASDDTLFLRGYDPKGDPQHPRFGVPPIVRRADPAAGKWLAPLAIPVVQKQPKQRDLIVACLAGKDRLAVLTEQLIPDDENHGEKVATCRLSLFWKNADAPAWSQTFDAGAPRPEPGVSLMAAVMPDYANSNLVKLNWLGDDILLCGGETADVICLGSDGKTKWRVPQIWEYQRGFIGPSVWQHYISRFGADDMDLEMADGGKNTVLAAGGPGTPAHTQAVADARKKLAEMRDAFYKQFQCAIVGGPVLLTVHADRGPDTHQIFVAVAKGPNAWNYGYLSDCLIYELSDDGTVEYMTSLPRMINGRQFSIGADGVSWACQQNAMVSLARQNVPREFGMGPGAPDRLCAINWYRQFRPAEPEAWLTADKTYDVIAYSPTAAFRTIAGGFIARKAEEIYHFPIAIIDLKTGADRTAILHVPFDGDVPEPETNRYGGGEHVGVFGPYLMGITKMQIHGSLLEITIGVDKARPK